MTATLDGDVLAVLAAGEVKLTGRDISRRIDASQDGTRRALERLVAQGIVLRETAGNAHLYRLNRDHLAAPLIERLASLRLELIDRLRKIIADWKVPPVAAMLYGSVARNDSDEQSDIDILVVRSGHIDAELPAWRDQLAELQAIATKMTGNDCRVFEAPDSTERRGVVKEAAEQGIELFGSLRAHKGKPKR